MPLKRVIGYILVYLFVDESAKAKMVMIADEPQPGTTEPGGFDAMLGILLHTPNEVANVGDRRSETGREGNPNVKMVRHYDESANLESGKLGLYPRNLRRENLTGGAQLDAVVRDTSKQRPTFGQRRRNEDAAAPRVVVALEAAKMPSSRF